MEFQQNGILADMESLDIDDLPSPEEVKPRRSLRRRSRLFEHLRVQNAETKNEDETSERAASGSIASESVASENLVEDTSKENEIPSARKRKTKNANDNITKMYTQCKKVKRLPSSMETIYEEPKLQKGKLVYVAARKQKRVLSFTSTTNTDKIKKRRMKIKKVLGKSASSLKLKKIPISKVIEKLKDVESLSSDTAAED